ncbi:hypothetical protein SAMN02927900_02866 [Rhizobium mongolense subsp. loessense]|uniref:Uncharacterized protein n=1 Tax=Rhizobium mongolense subsp. loessense TaxID=158890 RepID=A0A1G4RM97_9HYPH|nr:hypothetical protein [Rhizobium mongolense]SCW57857.1 hypothetical protein SAMN02927900_02866 [Rhizobium mongolense subsp. loessense]
MLFQVSSIVIIVITGSAIVAPFAFVATLLVVAIYTVPDVALANAVFAVGIDNPLAHAAAFG